MSEAISKQRVIEEIDGEQARWNALVAEVGDERMGTPGLAGGDWTFKDVAAHLLGWRERGLDVIEAAARDETAPPPPWPAQLQEDDEINAWIYEQYRDRPASDVLQATARSFDRYRTLVQTTSDEALNQPDHFPDLEGDSLASATVSGVLFGHLSDEHLPDIRAWLDRTASMPT